MSKIVKKSILSGEVENKLKDSKDFKKLKKIAVKPEEEIEVENPISGTKSIVKLSREGTTEEKLAAILISPDATREQKDALVANYLFERGLESASFLMELFRTKGAHTKETRAFKSQMRFDFELFVDTFTNWLESVSENMEEILGLDKSFYEKYVNSLDVARKLSNKPVSLIKMMKQMIGESTSPEKIAIYMLYIRFKEEAETLRDVVRSIAKKREEEKGASIYISKSGKIYDISDKNIEDIVIQERKEYEEQLKKHGTR